MRVLSVAKSFLQQMRSEFRSARWHRYLRGCGLADANLRVEVFHFGVPGATPTGHWPHRPAGFRWAGPV